MLNGKLSFFIFLFCIIFKIMRETVYILNQNNPKGGRRSRIKFYFSLMAVSLLLIGLFYIINYSPIFQIKEFKILGRQRLSDEAVLKILEPMVLGNRLSNFLGANNLLIWQEENL